MMRRKPISLSSELPFTLGSASYQWIANRIEFSEMIELVRSRVIRPEQFLQEEQLQSAVDAYRSFAEHERGWIKVKLEPAAQQTRAA
jgi:threonine dehydrogenase-like Zn-dependent dehydrogenase